MMPVTKNIGKVIRIVATKEKVMTVVTSIKLFSMSKPPGQNQGGFFVKVSLIN
jgi:hypothetical protein